MQRTRLNTLFSQITLRFRQWVFNPWRRLAVILLSLLFGNFFATAISVTAGQAAVPDVLISVFLVLGAEAVSWLYYRFTPRQQRERINRATELAAGELVVSPNAIAPVGLDAGPMRSRSTLAEALNAFKLGLTYGLFADAFKLGS
jgi:hypothetical protein